MTKMKTMKIKIISLFVLLIALAIFTPARAAGQKIKIKTENGVEVVYNPKTPQPSAGEPNRLFLEEEFTLSGTEAAFSQLVSFAVDAKHNIYVLDSQENSVKVFDNRGKFIRSFGKKGQGPGEMNTPTGIHLNPAGEVIVEDPLNQRLVYFSTDGTFLKTISTAKALGLSGLILDSQGNFVARQFSLLENKMVWELMKYKPDLTPLFKIDSTDFVNPLQGKINPFEMIIFYTIGPRDYTYYGKGKDYEITVLNPEGKIVRRIRKQFDPIKITEEDKKEMLSRIPEVGFAVKERLVFPEYYPAYQSFSVDEDGRLFVQTYEKGKQKGEHYFDIFNRNGWLINRTILKISPRIWKDKKLYALEETEDGYYLLRCFRVSWKTS